MNEKDRIFTGTLDDNDALEHYGTPRHSGRYPWGSGDNPYQRNASFLGTIRELENRGLSEVEIAKSMNMNTSDLRKRKHIANSENRAYEVREAKRLKAKGMSTSAIARRMGRNESSVRLLLNAEVEKRMTTTAKNSEILKDLVTKRKYIDVGAGEELYLGITKHSLGNALKILQQEGYQVNSVPTEQLGTGKMTTVKVLSGPGTQWKDAAKAVKDGAVKLVRDDVYSEDGGETLRIFEPPVSVDSKRIMVRYPEDGGDKMDGVIELRRGVDDISLGRARYAQVRIAVDGSHYLKGMAVYADDLPPGVDIRFNTSKSSSIPMINKEDPDHSVLKPMKKTKDGNIDLENPFGATIRDDDALLRAQRHYIDANGKEHLSALNIVSEEGTWRTWSKTLASQFLSKQTPALAKRQLDMAYNISKADYDEIMSLTNPTVRAKLLEDFAGRCEADAVNLSAAPLPRQSTKVILPLTNIGDKEIYAPGYKDGEQVALVRYPHGGIFEIPVLTVNNNNKEAQRMIGDALDAVGINATAAARLSGADFDGDTVLVLPTEGTKIKATGNNRPSAYKSLEDFDAKKMFPKYPGMHIMTDHEKGLEMGRVTNLITDMTVQGAPPEEICRAVKHSMVVIDALKHELDYKASEQEFGIPELMEKYQGKSTGGASTLLSQSTSKYKIPVRKEKPFSTMSYEEKQRYLQGEMIWEAPKTKAARLRKEGKPDKKQMTKEERHILEGGTPTEKRKLREWMRENNVDDSQLTDDQRHILQGGTALEKRELRKNLYNTGRMIVSDVDRMMETTKGYENDPYSLVRRDSEGNVKPIELIYAKYASDMKALAKQARASARAQVDIPYDPEMAKVYSNEVKSLKAKVAEAQRNAPLERQAQMIARKKLAAILYDHPEMDAEHRKRERGRQLDAARKLVGAGKQVIGAPKSKNPLTDREWEAISKGAVTKTFLKELLSNSDSARVKELCLPRTRTGLPSAKLARAKTMMRNGYTRQDICDALDISEGALINALGIENV